MLSFLPDTTKSPIHPIKTPVIDGEYTIGFSLY